jgi:acyl carrier protein
MTAPVLERVRSIAADVLKVPAGKITSESSTENVEGWDSVQHLNLVLALEQEFSVQFDPEEIDQMNSIGKVASILESKLEANA